MRQTRWNSSEHSNFDKELLYHEMEHIRLIHFSLIATSITLICLLVANWTNMPELITEITRMTNVSMAIDKNNTNEFMKHTQNLLGNCTSLADKSIERQLNIKIIEPIFQYSRTDSLLKFNGNQKTKSYETTLSKIKDLIIKPGLIDCIGEIEISMELRNWLARVQPAPVFPFTNTAMPWYFTSVEVIRYKPLSWPTSDHDRGEILVTVQVTHHNMNNFSSYGSSDYPELSTNITQTQEFRLYYKTIHLNITETIFTKEFPHVASNWQAIASLDSSDALNWAYTKRARELPYKAVSIFGIDIPGELLGVLCPIAFICAFMYILAYLRQIVNFITSHPDPNCIFPFSSPWLGAATHLPTRIVSLVSLSFPPVISSFLLTRNLHPFSGQIYGIIFGLIMILLAICIFHNGCKIARKTIICQISQRVIICK